MRCVAVEIVKIVDDSFPRLLECNLLDADGGCHIFIEKEPVVTSEDIGFTRQCSAQGLIACEVESEWCDEDNRLLARINTERPWGVESTTGVNRFTVLATNLHSWY